MTTATKRRFHLRPDPSYALRWMRDWHGSTPWEKQEEIVRLVFGGPHRRTVVRACHASGKTNIAAHIALAWLLGGEDRIVITTAPTGRQVRDLLWKEIRKIVGELHRRGAPGPRHPMPPRAPEFRISEDWFAIGFSSKDPVSFHGHHSAGGVLVILDEAPGIPDEMWEGLKGILTGEHDRLLAIGNPVEPAGQFYEAFRSGQFNTVTISAFDTPNIKAGRTVINGLVTQQWIDEIARPSWGEGSAMWRARVLGEFPTDAQDTLIPLSWLEAANQRWLELEENTNKPTRDLDEPAWDDHDQTAGLDIAYGGSAKTGIAIAQPQGIRRLVRPHVQPAGHDMTGALIGFVTATVRDNPRIKQVNGDGDGVGAPIMNDLATHYRGSMVRVVAMRGGMPAKDSEHFANRRAEWLWNLRMRCDPHSKNPMALPPDPKLQAQATSVRWRLNRKGQVQIESKGEMAERGMPSPDELDQCAYALAQEGTPTIGTIDPALVMSPVGGF